MSSGLYSGVSGLALGTGLYRDVSGLWSGATGLVSNFGSSNPYPGASLFLNFLTMTAPTFDSRITFSRGSNATLVDSTGKITYAPANLLTFSQEFDNAAWTKSNTTVTANATTAPDGTVTADKLVENTANSSHMVDATSSVLSGTVYATSIYVKAAGRTSFSFRTNNDASLATFDLATGTVGVATNATASMTAVGSGWYRCALVWAATSSASVIALRVRMLDGAGNSTYTGDGTSGLYVWGAQLEPVTYQTTPSTYQATTSTAYYGPRFDYDPVTLAPKGILIEEQRTNLLLRSEEFDNASWTKTRASVTPNATTAPNGTATADKLVEDSSASNTHIVAQTATIAASTSYTFSVYLKASERSFARILVGDTGGNNAVRVDVNLSDGTTASGTNGTGWSFTSASATAVGDGWYRVVVSGANTSATSGVVIVYTATALGTIIYTGNGTSGIYLWGAQLEAGAFATSYIPTVASTVTRSADVATMTGSNFSAWYNQAQGTFIVSLTPRGVPTGAANVRFLEVNNGTATSRNPLMFAGSGGTTYTQYRVAGVDQAQLSSSPLYYAANSTIAVGAAYATNDFATSFSGGAVATDTTGSTATNASELNIGYARSGSGGEIFCGHIRTLTYFNTRLPNAQLQSLTA